MLINDIYYSLKPLIPRRLQIALRRTIVHRKRLLYSEIWPIDEKAAKLPDHWPGWPYQKQFALVLTHDVETGKGQEKCPNLIRLEEELVFRSSFNFVPERYPERYNVSSDLRHYLTNNGFEVGVHGLHHDGKLYRSKEIFQKQAIRINYYLKEWEAVGFRSPSMHHNLEWIHGLNIEYDASTFDTDPFESQPDGMSTIFPFWVPGNTAQKGYVELPYTLPQDFTLFVLMKERSIDIWKRKLDWIVENGGMALLITHPDYMNFNRKKLGLGEYPAEYYAEFLKYIKYKYEDQYWHALPKQVARFWSKKSVK
jgi:peptidoglycan/xylan/chitin deacetylase (PgdA/CDA1 family)